MTVRRVLTVALMIVTLCFSIQRAAVWVLDRYYSDFSVYNPALLNLPKSILSKKMTGFKVYSLDGKYSLVAALTPDVFFFSRFVIVTCCFASQPGDAFSDAHQSWSFATVFFTQI